MNFWQALGTVVRESTFYKKQFVLFAAIFVIGFSAYYVAKSQFYKADFNSNNASLLEEKTGSGPAQIAYDYNIELREDGSLIVNGEKTSKGVTAYKDFDEITFIAVENPKYTLNEASVYLRLPANTKTDDVISAEAIGLGVGYKEKTNLDEQTILYTARNIGPNATFTIKANLKKGVIRYPVSKQILNFLYIQTVDWWLWASVIMAFTTIMVLFFLLKRRLAINYLPEPKYVIDHPPTDLPPAVVSVLKTGKVGGREIAATLVDLANRGFITIYSRGHTFTFGKTKKLESSNPAGLEKFERVLLDKIFSENYKSTKEDIQIRIGRHIFSRKVAEVYYLIYEMVTIYGFFEENPYRTHRRYKIGGILLFFISSACFAASILLKKGSGFSLFFWFALMISSTLIVKISSKIMPIRTRKGNEALKEWLSYENFIKVSQPISYRQDLPALYAQNLPNAIALNKEVEWTERFLQYPFYPPNWFDGEVSVRTLDELANELFPLVGYVGGSFHDVHEPTVD